MYGQLITDENCPTVAGSWALAEETAMKCATVNQRSATNRTFIRSEEREQHFSGRDSQPIRGCIDTSKAETENVSA
jgi:hypothetical protein